MNAAAGEPLLSRGYRARLLIALTTVSTFNFTDRNLVPILAEPLKRDLHLSDLQFGLLTGLGFAVVLDLARRQGHGSRGEFYWGGAASTAFWVDPEEDLLAIFLTQLMPSTTYNFRGQLRSLVYAAIDD